MASACGREPSRAYRRAVMDPLLRRTVLFGGGIVASVRLAGIFPAVRRRDDLLFGRTAARACGWCADFRLLFRRPLALICLWHRGLLCHELLAGARTRCDLRGARGGSTDGRLSSRAGRASPG